MGLMDNVNTLRQETQTAMEQILRSMKNNSAERADKRSERAEERTDSQEEVKKTTEEDIKERTESLINAARAESVERIERMEKTNEVYKSSLQEYRDELEGYRNSLEQYEKKLEGFRATEEDQMAAVQVALDLTYIKEELNGIVDRQKQITDKVEKIDKIDRLDSLIIEPIKKNYTANRTATIEKLDEIQENVRRSNQGLRAILWISLFINAISLGGLAFIILWILQIV
jgi:hypothetical protein